MHLYLKLLRAKALCVSCFLSRRLCSNSELSGVQKSWDELRCTFFSARMRWKQLRRTCLDDMWAGMGWDEKRSDQVTWGAKKSDDLRWDELLSVKCKCQSLNWCFMVGDLSCSISTSTSPWVWSVIWNRQQLDALQGHVDISWPWRCMKQWEPFISADLSFFAPSASILSRALNIFFGPFSGRYVCKDRRISGVSHPSGWILRLERTWSWSVHVNWKQQPVRHTRLKSDLLNIVIVRQTVWPHWRDSCGKC